MNLPHLRILVWCCRHEPMLTKALWFAFGGAVVGSLCQLLAS